MIRKYEKESAGTFGGNGKNGISVDGEEKKGYNGTERIKPDKRMTGKRKGKPK